MIFFNIREIIQIISGVMSPVIAQFNQAVGPTVPYNISQMGSFQWQPNGDWQRAHWDGENWVPEPGVNAPEDLKTKLDRARQDLLDRDATQRRALEEELNRVLPNSWPNRPNLPSYVPGVDNQCNRNFQDAQNWVAPRDPLVLDLDGDGIEAVGINPAAPVLFDMDGDGLKTATGWIKADDGMLVLDRNGNGLIDSGRELFGDSTILTRGPRAGQNAANGYEALADLDINGDGVINSLDAAYASLRIWQDANQDGISQAGEIQRFTSLDAAVATNTAQWVKVKNATNIIAFRASKFGTRGRFDVKKRCIRNVGKFTQTNCFTFSDWQLKNEKSCTC